jgi:WD40 repeat protein/uncharacterized caspase-like protein
VIVTYNHHWRVVTLFALLVTAARSTPAQSFGFVLRHRLTVEDGAVKALAFAPDGTCFVAASGRRGVVFEIPPEGAPVPRKAASLRAEVLAAAIAPGGGHTAFVDRAGNLTLVDRSSPSAGAAVARAHDGEATAVTFTSDGSYVVTGDGDGALRVWTTRAEHFADLGRGFEHQDGIVLVAPVPPGRRVLSVGRDRQVVLWDVDTQQALRPTKVESNVLSAALGDDGKTLALGLQRLTGNRFRSATPGSLAHTIRADDRLRLVDAETGTQIRDFGGEQQDLDAVGVTPDGRFVAAAGGGAEAAVWDATTGKRVTTIPFDAPVTAIAFSPDGRRMLVGTESGTLSLLELSGVAAAPRPAAPATILIFILEPVGLGDARDESTGEAYEIDAASMRIRGTVKSTAALKSLLVDGRDVTSLVPDGEGNYAFSAAVSMPQPGRRQIEIVAENEQGTLARRTFAVDRAAEIQRPDLGALRRIALVVGISSYADASIDLRYANADARALYELLTDRALGPAAFRPEDVRLLLDDEATVANINKGLREFLRRARENDLVLFFFAGHGAPDPNRIQDLYLLAHDTDPGNIAGTGLLMRHVREAIAEIPARHVLILTDSCHAAGIAAPASMRSLLANPIHQTFLEKMHHASGGLAILTASEAAQVSFENEKWGRHGVFTHFLLSGLRGSADTNADRIVTLGELMEHVRDGVRDATESRQIPAIGPTSFDRELPLVPVEPAAPNP